MVDAFIEERHGDEHSALTRPFWDACATGRLVRPVCANCQKNFFTPSYACPRCHSINWSYETSAGCGHIYSHTTIYRGPDASWVVPYVLAIVDMEEEWSMLSRLLVQIPDDSEPGSLIGHAVKVTFVPEDRPPFRTLPVFIPREEG